jgi:hypothetical protein
MKRMGKDGEGGYKARMEREVTKQGWRGRLQSKDGEGGYKARMEREIIKQG